MKTRILKIAAIAMILLGQCVLTPAYAADTHRDRKARHQTERTLQHRYGVKPDSWKYRQAVNVSYGFMTFARPEGTDLKPDFALSMSSGRTFFLHKRPIGKALKFSLDLGLELNYSCFESKPACLTKEIILHHAADVGVFLGPCFNISPANKFMIRLYGYFVPAAAFIVTSQKNQVAFLPSVRAGMELNYGRFGLGCEYVDGMAGYKVPNDLSGNSSNGSSNITTGPLKIQQSGIRVFVSFKFGRSRNY